MLAQRSRGKTVWRLGLLALVLAGLAAPGAAAQAAPADDPASCDLVASEEDEARNLVKLNASAPDSPHVVVHEVGHSIMDDVYDDAMPTTTNCTSHQINVTSSKTCAWVEGFADWFPTYIYNDKFFRWNSVSSLNLETPTWDTPGWSNFDSTEGRVAGALMDLVDGSNEGFDVYGEGIGNVWSTFQNHNSNTFKDFWTQRGTEFAAGVRQQDLRRPAAAAAERGHRAVRPGFRGVAPGGPRFRQGHVPMLRHRHPQVPACSGA